MLQDDAKLAMEEYAFIKAVAFAEWIIKNTYEYRASSWVYEHGMEYIKVCDTTAELYAIFQDTK